MLGIIEDNPYRVLGVYATSSKKDIVANQGRMKAFLKVGRTCEFPLDLPSLLPPVVRTEESVADANARLTLPQDQLKYAQFWFVKGTSLDDIAFNNLLSGDIDKAIDIWGKKNCASSYQNLMICHIIKNDLAKALEMVYNIYEPIDVGSFALVNLNCMELLKMVLGEDSTVSGDGLDEQMLDILTEELGAEKVLANMPDGMLKNQLIEKYVKGLIDQISQHVEVAKQSKDKGPDERLKAGTRLMVETKAALTELKVRLATTNVQYQMVADKLGLAILQCGIDYYNDSDDDDAAYKAMELQQYALSIVVGQMAKDRCQENVDILQGIIDELPPLEVIEEDKAIKAQLFVFQLQSKNIEMSIGLIKRCAPSLVAIKTKLGKTNEYYLRISTLVANSALGNLIEEVNKAQESDDIPALIKVLTEAWRATLYLDKLDKTNEYASGRYHECRNALHDIIDRLKGFESPSILYSYRYGCGWANKLDVSDVDLRTEEEVYAECDTLARLKAYLQKYPSGEICSGSELKD